MRGRRGMRGAGALLAALLLPACMTAPAPSPGAARPAAPATAAGAAVPPAMQWLYGSGEGGAASLQAWHAFRDYVLRSARSRPADSVVLAEGSTLATPLFVPCGSRPLAVMLDVDETAIQNLGYEYDEAVRGRGFDPAVWNRWERTGAGSVAPMPGAVTALRALRAAGVEMIFNSNRQAGNATHTEAALNFAGIGPARHGETLFLQGDVAPGSGKDPRRAAVAERWCVIAMAGDQLGDFSDLFNARTLPVSERRRAAISGPFAGLWGNGWFMLSNPVYGPGLRGGFDEVFPEDLRWSDPGDGE